MTDSTNRALMSGPEHYKEAEDLLVQSERSDLPESVVAWLTGAAQAHATLALVAVTAELASHANPPSTRTYDGHGWRELFHSETSSATSPPGGETWSGFFVTPT